METQDVTEMLDRLKLAGLKFTEAEKMTYVQRKDDLGPVGKKDELLLGFKRCGACGHAKKFYLFNKNSGSKTCTTGNCKECQKKTSKKSYTKTKHQRNYALYYQERKEEKREAARQRYVLNRDVINARHKIYLSTDKGKKVMKRAHAKRRKAMQANSGVPYTRQMVLDRDAMFSGRDLPTCWICGLPIEDMSGKGLHLDHVVSINNGGLDCFTNIACTHATCNLKKEKDDRHLEEAAVKEIKSRALAFMEAYPELFESTSEVKGETK